MMNRLLLAFAFAVAPTLVYGDQPPTWPQFGGAGRNVSLEDQSVPDEFGPTKNVRWKKSIPAGGSSPCIWGERLFLTGSEAEKLSVLCFQRRSGEMLWRADFPGRKQTFGHPASSPAAPTTCTDGERVYAYFGSYGLVALDMQGKEVWKKTFPFTPSQFGHGTSPIVHDGSIFLVRDLNRGASSIYCFDAKTGQKRWETPRPEAQANFGTPIVWRGDLVVAGSSMVKAYDLENGEPQWWVGGVTAIACTSPVASRDALYFGGWSTPNVAPEKRLATGFDESSGLSEEDLKSVESAFAKLDRNRDNKLTRDEIPAGRAKDAFSIFDFNRNGAWEPRELQGLLAAPTAPGRNNLLAIKPGGAGDVTETNVLWEKRRGIPYVASPLLYKGRLYYFKKGGLATCIDAKSGKAFYESKRLGVGGEYYATPVGVGDRVIVGAQRGVVLVLQVDDKLKVVAKNTFDEDIVATPAVVEDTLYLRTSKYLYAIGALEAE